MAGLTSPVPAEGLTTENAPNAVPVDPPGPAGFNSRPKVRHDFTLRLTITPTNSTRLAAGRRNRNPKFNEPHCGVRLPRAQHVFSGQLCSAFQTSGRRAAGLRAGLAALWHRWLGYAALAQKASDRDSHERPDTATAVSRVISGQFPVYDLHAVWHAHDQRGGRWRHHGIHSGRGGGAELAFSAGTRQPAGLGGGRLRGDWYWPGFTITKGASCACGCWTGSQFRIKKLVDW